MANGSNPYPTTGGLSNFYRGDVKPIKGIMRTSSGVPLDITGWTIIMSIKKAANDDDVDALVRKQACLTDPINGEYLLDLTSTDLDIPVRSYTWDIRAKDTSGNIQTVAVGTFWCLQPVTHTI